MAVATAKRSRRAGRPASGDGGGNGPSKAEHFHQYDVPVECEAFVRCRLYAAQDADGKWFASDTLQIGGGQVRNGALTPASAPKFESEAAALRAAVGELERWLALEAHEYREFAPAIGQAVHEWGELVHKHVAGWELAEMVAKRDAAQARPTSRPCHERPCQEGPRQIVDVPLDKIHRHPGNRTIGKGTCKDLAKDLQARGLLQPIKIRDPGPSWKLPEGHYQIVYGERRVIAARSLGWDTIPAEIVTLDDRQTQEAIAAENGHRAQLNDVERARRLAEMIKPVAQGGGGLTQTAAAAAMGIDQSTASTLLKLTRLPPAWQDQVIAGAITGSQLRPVLEYADCPRVLEMFLQDFEWCRKSKLAEEAGSWATRAAIEDTVQNLLSDRTRPMGKLDLLKGEGQWSLPTFDAEAAAGLDVIELPGGQRRALNVDQFQELQHAAQKSNGRPKTGIIDLTQQARPQTGKAKPAAPSAAEIRKQQAEQDRELAERIRRPGGLAEQGLRWAMAARIAEILRAHPGGTEATHQAGQVLLDAARESAGSSELDYTAWRYLGWRLIRADQLVKGESPGQISGYKNHEAYARYTSATLQAVNDYATAGLVHLAVMGRLILFPSDERIHEPGRLTKWGDWPDRWPWIDEKIVAELAELLGAGLVDTWRAAQRPGAARRWCELLIATHNTRRHRVGLAEELQVATCSEDSIEEVKQAIVKAHTGRGLPLPAVLKDFAKAKRRVAKGKTRFS